MIDFYDGGGGDQRPKSLLMRKLNLTENEKSDLVAFLESLTGEVEKKESHTAAE